MVGMKALYVTEAALRLQAAGRVRVDSIVLPGAAATLETTNDSRAQGASQLSPQHSSGETDASEFDCASLKSSQARSVQVRCDLLVPDLAE